MLNRPICLFGAGDYGLQALKHYGSERVAYFVDNDPDKAGSEYGGKKVISFGEFQDISEGYSLIVASSYYRQISEQLIKKGITEYWYYSPAYSCAIQYVVSEINKRQLREIALYGVDSDTEKFLDYLFRNYEADVKCSISAVIDNADSPYLGTVCAGHEVSELDIAVCRDSLFVIGSWKYHAAYYLELVQLLGKKDKTINPFAMRAICDTDEIVVNPYIRGLAHTVNDNIVKGVSAYVEIAMKGVPLFKYVEIETINRCNGVCDFCPVSKKVDPREKKVMTLELFQSIISQLCDMDYDGGLSLFSNNEPLLDERIAWLSEYARNALPKARIHMYSNGTLFTIEKFKELIPHLDELIIDNYTNNLELIKPCREIRDYIEQHDELRRKVTIVLRKPSDVLASRGGDAPNRQASLISYGDEKCALPFQQLVIRPDGKVSLCCSDALGRDTMGDLSKETIMDVWYSAKYEALRKAVSQGRKHWEHCKFCDTFNLY
jgi:radical SAM protein with 4Fe4S-binding SPASM domain